MTFRPATPPSPLPRDEGEFGPPASCNGRFIRIYYSVVNSPLPGKTRIRIQVCPLRAIQAPTCRRYCKLGSSPRPPQVRALSRTSYQSSVRTTDRATVKIGRQGELAKQVTPAHTPKSKNRNLGGPLLLYLRYRIEIRQSREGK